MKRIRSLLFFLRAGDWQAISNRLFGYGLGWVVPEFLLRRSRTTSIPTMSKSDFILMAEKQLQMFLFANGSLAFTPSQAPKASVILVLFNKDYFTFQCLQSLVTALSGFESEVIIIDNRSKDRTGELLERLQGVKVVRNQENVGFLLACNQALELVTGEFVLFLNNDTIVYPGTIRAAWQVFDEEDNVGGVGGRLILPNGRLQEAGNLIYRDASCKTIARDYPPDHPSVMFRRDTDYCSGAFLMTPTKVLRDLGGFDEDLAPAYYEETEYCLRLKKRGLRVVYEPRVAITHFEFGSAPKLSDSMTLMHRNRLKVIAKHAELLARYPEPTEGSAPEPRPWSVPRKKRLLYIDDRPPHKHIGAGFPRSWEILQTIIGEDIDVTLFATLNAERDWDLAYADLPKGLEIQLIGGYANLRAFLANRLHEYDYLWISRPHNFAFILDKCKQHLESFAGRVVYDAEAIFSAREVLEKKATGRIVRTLYQSKKHPELAMAKYADLVVSVTKVEGEKLCAGQLEKLRIVGHNHDLRMTPATFQERQGIVFLGSLHGHPSPNSDSIIWYLEHVLPRLKEKIGDIPLTLVGYNEVQDHKVFRPFKKDIVHVGKVDELGPALNQYRLMVIPTRFAAGVPQKAYDAATFGIPCVCTDLIAEQMHWQSGVHTLAASADDPGEFANKVAELYSSEQTWQTIRSGMETHMRAAQAHGNIKENIQKIVREL